MHTYSPIQLLNIDLGFCEDSGLTNPGPVLGTCCTCPSICTPNVTHDDCTEALQGAWRLGGSCSPNPCPGVPPNDDCSSPFVVSGIPDFGELVIAGNNICATDDGPGLSSDPQLDGCFASLIGGADMHNDVWYLVDRPCGLLTIESCNDADFDQMIAVYDATSGCPLETFDEIDCNDDGCGSGGPSSVTVHIDEGDRLLIRVGGWDDGASPFAEPRGQFNLHFRRILGADRGRAGVQFVPPGLAAPPHDILKNRYISVQPGGEDGGNLGRKFFIRLTLAETLVDGVTPPITLWATEPDEDCISIVVPEQPSTAQNWILCPTLHLTGCPIIPTTTYWINTVGCDHVSETLVAQTQARPTEDKWWGDAVGVFTGPVGNPPNVWTAPQGVTNFDDVNAALLTFKNPGVLNATHVSVTDIHPNRPDLGGISVHPNLQVNIDDVFQFVRCFQGEEYLGGQLDLCTNP